MSTYTQLFGSGNSPIGTYYTGNLSNNSDYILCDGSTYLKADYPSLDTSYMMTFGNNTVQLGPTLAAGIVGMEKGGNTIVAWGSTTVYHTSTDNGVTWTSRTLPVNANNFGYTNGVWFHFGIGQTATIHTSTDAIAWTARTLPFAIVSTHVGYFNGLYMIGGFIAGASGQVCVVRSTDVSAWIHANISALPNASIASVRLGSIKSDPLLGFLYGANDGSISGVGTTLDGITRAGMGPSELSYQGVAANLIGTNLCYDDTGNYSTDSAFGRGLYLKASVNSFGTQLHRNIFLKKIISTYYVSDAWGGPAVAAYTTSNAAVNARCAVYGTDKVMWVNSTTGVLNYINIDTTKFRAIPPRATIDDYNGAVYIKAR